MLAVANRSRVSIHEKFWPEQEHAWYVVHPVKIFLASTLIIQKLVAVSYTVCAHVGCPKNWGKQGPAPMIKGVADALETRPFPT